MTLYKGRIDAAPNDLMDALNRSLPVDIRLLPYDVATNRAWARELSAIGIYSQEELAAVEVALDHILKDWENGAFDPLPDDEDIHTLIERLLTEELGSIGARIHTGRSRNDQVVSDLHLYVVDALEMLAKKSAKVIDTLAKVSEAYPQAIMSGTTHMQPAQPILLGHFLMSLAFALIRDHGRLIDARKRANRCPLGCGALAGSGFAIDRKRMAKSMGFEGLSENALDAISDRDIVQETTGACAMLATHLSRYAEQFVVWSNPAFGFISFSDTWSTGSSMMPQKRNPDAMELVRGKSARIIGNNTALLALTKGLPLSYAKDLQEDKTLLFDTVDTTVLILDVFGEALASASFNVAKMEESLTADLLATDLADRLVEANVPFRTAHERVARFVGRVERAQSDLLCAPDQWYSDDFPELVGMEPLTFQSGLERRAVIGGTAPERVADQAASIRKWLSKIGDD